MWVLIAIGVVSALVLWLRWNFNHWKNKRIPYVEPETLFGNMRSAITGAKSPAILSQDIYNTFPGAPAVGFFRLRTPVLQPKCLEFVKAIFVTQFESFCENGLFADKKADPLLGMSPFFASGAEWEKARGVHVRFLTDSKLSRIFEYLEEVCGDFVKYINENPNKKYDTFDFSNNYITDTYSSCVFGVKTRSFEGVNPEFTNYTMKLVDLNWRFVLFALNPDIFNRLRIRVIRKDCGDYFYNLVKEVVATKKKEKSSKADFVQSMISEKDEDMSLTYMTSQTLAYFLDGFGTSSAELSFLLYMLALHPEAQETLREEINKVDKIDFATVNRLPHLDSFFNETVRMYPAGPTLPKLCSRDVTVNTSKGSFELKRGDYLEVPVYAIHRDPEHFPEPQKFIPDRFLNKPNHPALWTFGGGPRNCIGEKFVRTQIKTCVIHLLKSFKILPGTEDRELPTINRVKAYVLFPDKDMTVIFQKL